MARGPTNASIVSANRKALSLSTPASLLYAYHQNLFKKFGEGIANESFTDDNKNAVITAALQELGVNPEVGLKLAEESFFDRIKGLRSPIPRTVPTLDGKLITWEEFDSFIDKYSKNPIIMQRLGLDSDTDNRGVPALSASQVSARISSKVGKRTSGANKAQKVIDRIPETHLIEYTVYENQIPTDLTSFFKHQVTILISTSQIAMQWKPTGTAFGMILDVIKPDGEIVARHYIKQSFNPVPNESYSALDLVTKSISFVPDDIIPFRSYSTDSSGDWNSGELPLNTDVTVIDPTSTDYINYDIGHKVGDATQRLKRQLIVLEQLYEKETNKVIKDGYKAKIERHKEFIKQAELLDQSDIVEGNDLGDLSAIEVLQIQKELLKTAGTVNVLTVTRQTMTDGNKGQLTFSINSETSITNAPTLNQYMVEFASFNRLKGGKARAIMDAAMKSLLMPQSTSAATLLMHKELADIFGAEEIYSIAKRNQTKRSKTTKSNTKVKIFTPKKVAITSSKAREAQAKMAKAPSKLKALPSSRRNKSSKLNNYDSLVNILNSNIREYVIAEMNHPALQNRSGRFASSVKVLSVQSTSSLEATIRYTYLKSPYMIFSTTKGKNPWNSVRQRDPASIIDLAIKKMGLKLLNNMVIRTEEN